MRTRRFPASAAVVALAGLSACASVNLKHVAPTVIPNDAVGKITPCTPGKEGLTVRLTEGTQTVVENARVARMTLPAPLQDDLVIVQLTNALTYQVVSGRR